MSTTHKIIIVIIWAVFSVYLFIFSETGVLSRERYEERTKEMNKRIAKLREENRALEIKIKRLKSDDEYLKAMAKSHGLKEDDKDKLIVFVDRQARQSMRELEKVQDKQISTSASLRSAQTKSYAGLIIFIIVTVVGFIFIRSRQRMNEEDDDIFIENGKDIGAEPWDKEGFNPADDFDSYQEEEEETDDEDDKDVDDDDVKSNDIPVGYEDEAEELEKIKRMMQDFNDNEK